MHLLLVCSFGLQLGRIAHHIRSIPGFVKRLLFVLEAVAGLVSKSSANYVPPTVVTELMQRSSARTLLKTVLSLTSS